MMKRFLLIGIVGIISFLAAATVQADVTYRIQIEEAVSRKNVIIRHPETNEQYLLYLETGCSQLETGQTVSLVIRGNLNSNSDYVKVDYLHRCDISQAEKFTEKLYIKLVLQGEEVYVTDEAGIEYFVTHTDLCPSIPRYFEDNIYVLKGGKDLRKGDRLIMPNNEGICSISFVRVVPERLTEPTTSVTVKEKRPTTVTSVRAIPKNGSVFLVWRAAKDDDGISHYLISYSPYKINSKDVPAEAMPNQLTSRTTHYQVRNLRNDESYFFYVLAVDKRGNTSSEWSVGASTTPRSTLRPTQTYQSGTHDLNVRVDKETERSYFIRWNPHPLANRYSVALSVDGKRTWAITNHPAPYIRLIKREAWEDTELTLLVRAFGLREFLQEEELDF